MNQKIKPKEPLPAFSEKASRTQTALCGALLLLLEEERPFEQITVKELTKRAGVGYATFFRRYKDKDALLHDLAANEIQKLLAMTLPIFYSVDDSLTSNKALCAYVWDNRRLWKSLLTGGAASILKEEYLQQALKVTIVRDPAPWLPDDLAITFSVTAVVEILAWWLKQESPKTVKEMAEVLHRLSIAPIFPPTRVGAW